MFGLTVITSTEYEELIADKEDLGDRVRLLESKLSNADNALNSVEQKLQNTLTESNRSREANVSQLETLQEKIARSQEINTNLEQNLDQALESISNLQKSLAKVKQQLTDSQSWVKQLEEQNKKHINAIAKFVAQCGEAERERNELIVEKGLLKASLKNHQQSVAIAVDNLSIEIKNIFGE